MKGKIGKPHGKKLFAAELILAVLLAVACAVVGMSNYFWESNDWYPLISDTMGHMAKVNYISEELLKGNIPSWFPSWYNGATVTQYYVPLSYYIMVPIYWITENVMVTFKIFCGLMLAIGGMGVWAFCYKVIGRFCGLIGIITYCLQPFFLVSLYGLGVIAQGPIFAISPWFLLAILSLGKKPGRVNFFFSALTGVLLILSHAMHAFMVCGCTAIVLIIMFIFKKMPLKNLIICGLAIVFAGLLTAFWSVVGVTGFENPGVPYLLPEAALNYTANYNWFLPTDSLKQPYYSILINVISLVSLFLFIVSEKRNKNDLDKKYFLFPIMALMILTLVFSFGERIPGFGLIPMSSGLVPGRILSYTALMASIACAYGIYILWKANNFKVLLKIIVILCIAIIIVGLNPYKKSYKFLNPNEYDFFKKLSGSEEKEFEKGRYQWIGAVDSYETYFPLLYNYNLSDGWNIEGTPHNKTIWNNNIAISIDAYPYMEKQLYFWNVRYLLISDQYENLKKYVSENTEFVEKEIDRVNNSFYINSTPSSYYLLDSRNAILISSGFDGIGIMFPNLVQGKSGDLCDYSVEELEKYDLVYIYEPVIDTLSYQQEFEKIVESLIDKGVNVVIEPVPTTRFDILGVRVVDEVLESSPF